MRRTKFVVNNSVIQKTNERWTNDIDRSEKMKNIFFLTKKNERFQKNDRFLLNEQFYQLENERNRREINDNFENQRNQFSLSN